MNDHPVFVTRKVVASSPIAEGETVFVLPKVYTTERDRYSIQLAPGFHQAFTDDIDDYIDHSCQPNLELVVKGEPTNPDQVRFVAIREIRKGEEVTWDYMTAESELSSPFDCFCGAPNCRGRIT